MRFICALAFLLLALGLPRPAQAVTVTVPDNYATITAAIASGADVIVVKDGTYSESIVISRPLELRAADPSFLGLPSAFPTITGTLTLNQLVTTSGGPIIVSGFWIQGAVTQTLGWTKSAILRECRLDKGITSNGTAVGALSLRGCIVRGDVELNPYYIEMSCTTMIGGGLTANYEGDGRVRHNYIVGPADVGLKLTTDDGGCPVYENTITGTTDGIVLVNAGGTSVTYNDVLGVSNDAFRVERSGAGLGSATFQHNLVQNAGRHAYNLTGSTTVTFNTIMGATGYGVLASGDGGTALAPAISGNTISNANAGGILVTGSGAYVADCSNNSVLYAGGNGISLAAATTVGYNVVGRSGGSGIIVTDDYGTATYRNNTSFLNGSTGLLLGGSATTSLLNNISYGNIGYGLRWVGSGTPTIGCNDYFGNTAGSVNGISAGISDRFVNPLFCNLTNNDVWLSQSSPLVGTACGQIGAHSVSCTSPADVPATAPVGALEFSAGARPASGPVAFSWAPLAEPGLVEVFDSGGARIWSSALPAGSRGVHWNAGRGVSTVQPGVYFARLHCGGREERQRVVVLR